MKLFKILSQAALKIQRRGRKEKYLFILDSLWVTQLKLCSMQQTINNQDNHVTLKDTQHMMYKMATRHNNESN